jgi:hypothetical protein
VIRRRRAVIVVAGVIVMIYAGGLAWGYQRLAWAAMKNLADFNLIRAAPAVSIDRSRTSISKLQEEFLRERLHITSMPTTPRVRVAVVWNALICARVQAGHYTGPLGAEGKDTLFVCIFGTWLPVYTFGHAMA